MVDPLSIASSVVSLSSGCLLTVKRLIEVAGKFKDAPKLIHSLSSEAKVIAISLSQLHNIFVSDEHSILSQALLTPDIRTALDIALTGCTVTLSCIEDETRSLAAKLESDQKIKFADRAKVVWKDDRFKELLQQLHRQHNVIAILQQGFQMKILADIVPHLWSHHPAFTRVAADTESLRGLYPQMKGAKSFLESTEEGGGEEATFSIVSERQFEFDDIVTNSQAYRRVVVAATQTLRATHSRIVSAEGVSKDTSDGQANNSDSKVLDSNSANQSRKLGGSRWTNTVEENLIQKGYFLPPSTIDTSNFVQQLRGYVTHVDDIEKKLRDAGEESSALREMLKQKGSAIQDLEWDVQQQFGERKKISGTLCQTLYDMKKVEADCWKWKEKYTLVQLEVLGLKAKVDEIKENFVQQRKEWGQKRQELEEKLLKLGSERDEFKSNWLFESEKVEKLSKEMEEDADMARKALENKIWEGKTLQIGSTLLIQLQPPISLQKASNGSRLLQAFKSPEAPEGRVTRWNNSQKRWLFVEICTDKSQFKKPTASAVRPPRRPSSPALEPESAEETLSPVTSDFDSAVTSDSMDW
ncbi:uncharacterized protein LY89DRAFT_722011 [Mollisia scopiformis]|uniref:Fungal N-terminal domain-containing protein n=1 Tax=Mollisia scopiformis TaxID=149040 RepID=A0A194WWM5_MOLSC|nr:uncharacterized protein LY89DRAFT_722011 [Mollisia scopiformis]KUJ12373.1 hypothetical protein LY89DRAFT_722011 [Mollisia scopiformis]